MSILNKYYVIVNILLISFCISSCSTNTKQIDPKTGQWKAELYNIDGIMIPFTFEIKDSSNKKYWMIRNADEVILVDDISVSGDSLKVIMPFFDSEFMLFSYGDSLLGRWVKNYDNYSVSMPFKAYHNNSKRFDVNSEKINSDFEGTWNTLFISDDKTDSTPAVAEFKIVENKIYGTFLTTTGDYRYLEGVTNQNNIYLSTFDGSHAYFFSAKLSDDKSKIIEGKFYSGLKSFESWSAVKDPNAKLPDADKLTFLKDGYDEINFTFKNLKGKDVSLNDEQYKNKVVLIQIMGSWCPNCMDETNYLVPFYEQNKEKGLEVIGLCYERSEDFNIASKNALNMKKRLNIPYELLIAGTNKKGNVNESLPMLKNFIAFPTMIIIDKRGKVRKIHTGYSGPATGIHYVEFKSEFESFINKLISEN